MDTYLYMYVKWTCPPTLWKGQNLSAREDKTKPKILCVTFRHLWPNWVVKVDVKNGLLTKELNDLYNKALLETWQFLVIIIIK